MLPKTSYPQTPYVVGLDWIELPVRRPAATAEIYRQIGFSPRGTVGRWPRLSAGGANLLLRAKRNGKGVSAQGAVSGLVIQFTVDNVELKREQLLELGLKPSGVRSNKRGDCYFQWVDPDGHTVRFVGPTRRVTDERID